MEEAKIIVDNYINTNLTTKDDVLKLFNLLLDEPTYPQSLKDFYYIINSIENNKLDKTTLNNMKKDAILKYLPYYNKNNILLYIIYFIVMTYSLFN